MKWLWLIAVIVAVGVGLVVFSGKKTSNDTKPSPPSKPTAMNGRQPANTVLPINTLKYLLKTSKGH